MSYLVLIFSGVAIYYLYTIWRDVRDRKNASEDFELRKQNPVINDDRSEPSEKWEDMIEGAQGRAEELQDNIIANIKAKSIPDTIAERREGGYGENIKCPVLYIENKFARYYRMLLVGLDYGTYLDIKWTYAFDRPDRHFKGGGSLIVNYLDKREQERYEEMLKSDGKLKLGFKNMDRWKEMINLVIKEEIKLMKEEPITGFHEQSRDAKGFVNLS